MKTRVYVKCKSFDFEKLFKKKGYAYAERALEACKQHEKEYKRRMKNKRKK